MSPAVRSRRLLAAAAVAVVAVSSLVTASPSPAAATTTAALATEVVPGRGTMDTTEEVLSPSTPVTSRSGLPAPGSTGWATVVELLEGTQMLALSWDGTRSGPDGPASGRVSVRVQSGGVWGPWTQYAPEADDGGEGAGRVGSDLVWLGSAGAEAAEVRVDAGPLAALQLLRMRYHEGPPQTVPVPDTRGATGRAAARPTIRPRSDWTTTGYGCSGGPEVASGLKHVVVHHTASGNDYTQGQVVGILQGMRQYQVGSLGWCDMAYNFIVDRFGTIWQGRAGDVTKPVIGSHARGFNTAGAGVSLLGQFHPGASPASSTPTAAMLDSAARVIAWKLGLHGLDPRGTVNVTSGGSTRYPAGRVVALPVVNYHQLTSTTSCPGDNVISRFAALRTAVAGYMTSTTPDPPDPPDPPRSWAPFSSVEDLVWRQYSDFQRNPGTYDERRQWAVSLANGANNRNALVAALVRSTAVDKGSASAIRLYLAYFDRIPDSAGIRYWWGRMDGGYDIRKVSADFAFSAEFRATYGGLTDAQYVRLVYRNVMGREGEAAGVAYWTDQLERRRESRGGMMVLFADSAENKAAARDEVEVIHVHQVMLGRAIGASAHAQWVARVSDQGIGSLIGTLFGSSEYAARVS